MSLLDIIPTELSRESVDEFKRLYKKHYNENICYFHAHEELHRLLNFFAIIIESNSRDKQKD